MTDDEITHAAAYIAARAAREIDPHLIETTYPHGHDALHIYAALLAANIHLSWPNPAITHRAKRLAVISSPLIVPILAIMWTAWRLAHLLQSRPGKRRRSNS
jgi:hypothetical protein